VQPLNVDETILNGENYYEPFFINLQLPSFEDGWDVIIFVSVP
jgi:hypothetical protein